MLCEKFKL
jgi:hypothetical protein